MSMPAALQRRRDYAGPALFSYGFRPFFLGAAAWAALSILLWLPLYEGHIGLRSHLPPLDWHIHEMLFGYAAAAVAGFLLTAIPNWTGRLPVCGAPLAGLFALWLAGRIALLASADIGGMGAAAVDVAFLAVLAAVAAREIVAGKNWRNLRVLVALGCLILANVVFHAEVLLRGTAEYGVRGGIAALLLLIMLIGGRIVPSFTHNWLARNNPGRLPVSFARYDMICIAASVPALAAWIAVPLHPLTGALLALSGGLQAWRLARWAGDRTLADRLVLVLHVGYAFVPAGMLLSAAAAWWPQVPPSAGIHAWTAGAVGLMTLAVMTRASLGHTGRPLVADASTQAIYALALAAAVLRIVAAVNGSMPLIQLSGLLWIAAFAGFCFAYGPLLALRPPGWKRAGD